VRELVEEEVGGGALKDVTVLLVEGLAIVAIAAGEHERAQRVGVLKVDALREHVRVEGVLPQYKGAQQAHCGFVEATQGFGGSNCRLEYTLPLCSSARMMPFDQTSASFGCSSGVELITL
jgi:hypothetical protein